MKSQNNKLLISKILNKIGIIFLFGALFIPFAPAITLVLSSNSKSYGSTFAFMFGGDITTQNISYESYGISILTLISFLILLLSFVLIIISLFIQRNKLNLSKTIIFIVSITVLISSIMFLCTHRSLASVLADTLIKSHNPLITDTIFNNTKLSFGVYGTSIFGFISSLSLLSSLILDGTLDTLVTKTKNK